MARRPKRTYNEATGQWEVEKVWDFRDDQGFYWKDGVQVDSKGRPIPVNEQGQNTDGAPADENNVTLNPTEQYLSEDDPRNLISVGSKIMSQAEARGGGSMGQEGQDISGSMRRIVEDQTKGAASTRNIAPSLINKKAKQNA